MSRRKRHYRKLLGSLPGAGEGVAEKPAQCGGDQLAVLSTLPHHTVRGRYRTRKKRTVPGRLITERVRCRIWMLDGSITEHVYRVVKRTSVDTVVYSQLFASGEAPVCTRPVSERKRQLIGRWLSPRK